jgi:DNA polymerase-3 subunit delta'
MMQIHGNSQQQEKIKSLLISPIPPNPIMICGAQGIGKFSYIKQLVSEINSDTDILFPGLDVDSARESVKFSCLAPVFNDYKFIVINDGDFLSLQAQDAYLKSCEESPDWSIFIFIASDSSHISSALLSRIRETIRWSILSNEEMRNFISKDVNENVMDICRGRPGIYETIINNESLLSFSSDVSEFLSDIPRSSIIPSAIIEAKKSDKNYRSIISRICFHTALKLNHNVDRVCSVLDFASNLSKYPSLDIESYWIKATLNI